MALPLRLAVTGKTIPSSRAGGGQDNGLGIGLDGSWVVSVVEARVMRRLQRPRPRWRAVSCQQFRDNEHRLQLRALAYNVATFLRCIEMPEAMGDWSLTSLQL